VALGEPTTLFFATQILASKKKVAHENDNVKLDKAIDELSIRFGNHKLTMFFLLSSLLWMIKYHLKYHENNIVSCQCSIHVIIKC
jgi:hypothetical protein